MLQRPDPPMRTHLVIRVTDATKARLVVRAEAQVLSVTALVESLVRRLERAVLKRLSADEVVAYLDRDLIAAMLARACKGKKTSLKAALLDQRIVACLGNIYVCEALYRARLSPKRLASTIATKASEPNERAERLVDGIKAVLNDAIKAGGSSLRDHKRTDGDLGLFQHHFQVYDREGERCQTPGCSGIVKRIVQNGRSTFYCPVCQK